MSQSLALRTPAQLIELAVEKGASADELGKLMDLKLRWDANEARLAYIAAMQKFKENLPEIFKTKKVQYPNKDGSQTTYHYAELDKVTEILGDALKAVGIIHSWRTGEGENGRIIVTCVFTHAMGHSEDVATLAGPPDTSGGKNNIQAIGSTTSYLQRYTLLAGGGVATKGQDNDGATDGISAEGVQDYLITFQDSKDTEELQRNFAAAWTTAKKINDRVSMARFLAAKDSRKKELLHG